MRFFKELARDVDKIKKGIKGFITATLFDGSTTKIKGGEAKW